MQVPLLGGKAPRKRGPGLDLIWSAEVLASSLYEGHTLDLFADTCWPPMLHEDKAVSCTQLRTSIQAFSILFPVGRSQVLNTEVQ